MCIAFDLDHVHGKKNFLLLHELLINLKKFRKLSMSGSSFIFDNVQVGRPMGSRSMPENDMLAARVKCFCRAEIVSLTVGVQVD